MKSSEHGYLYEAEIVYDFLVCTVAPLKDNYESGKPDFGFLYPAFSWRMPDRDMIDIYNKDPDHPQTTLTEILMGLRRRAPSPPLRCRGSPPSRQRSCRHLDRSRHRPAA